METHDPAAALALVASSRAALADRLVTPPWYHPAFGVLVGGFTGLYVAGFRIVAAAGFAVGALLLMQAYRRTTGVWVNGWQAGEATPWAIAIGVAMLLGLVGGLALYRGLHWQPAPYVAGLAVLVATIPLGRRFDAALRAPLRRS